MPWGIAAAGIASAAIGAGASMSAAGTQANAANNASRVQQNEFNTISSNLSPFMNTGVNALAPLRNLTGTTPETPYLIPGTGNDGFNQYALDGENYVVPKALGAAFTPSSPGVGDLGPLGPGFVNPNAGTGGNPLTAPLTAPFDISAFNDAFNKGITSPTASTAGAPNLINGYAIDPSFNFDLDQGNNAILNNASAKGGALSGNTLRDLMKFGQGLQSQNYWSDLMNNYNMLTGSQGNLFNKLMGIAGMGQSAANQTGAFGQNTANNVAGNMIGAGNAQAAGMVGAANAVNNGTNSAVQNYLLYQMMQNNNNQVPYGPGDQSNGGSLVV